MGSLLAALAVVFLAELGDKTQLVAMGFATRHKPLPVLGGVVLAYAVSNLIAVVVGGAVGAALPTRAIGIAGGLLFLGFAVWTFVSGDDGDEEAVVDGSGDVGDVAPAAGAARTASRSVVVSVAAAMFLAELGDKTQIATATLASRGEPVLVWLGATIGIALSGALAVLVGRTVGARLPARATRIGSAVLFAVFGLALLASAL